VTGAQADKGRAFRALHERKSAFIIPNSWDVGTARLPAHLGFEALAITSAGYAVSAGQQDNTIDRPAPRRKLHAHEETSYDDPSPSPLTTTRFRPATLAR
jgi:hypothetical protein